MGQFKWRAMRLEYSLEGVKPPTRDLVEKTCGLFRAEGLTAY
jgi:pyruvate formate lyase activating enzyme